MRPEFCAVVSKMTKVVILIVNHLIPVVRLLVPIASIELNNLDMFMVFPNIEAHYG